MSPAREGLAASFRSRLAGDAARAAASATWLVAAAVTLAAFSAGIAHWNRTHWLFSWEHGFVKRGLVGTVYSGFVDVVTARDLLVLQCLIALAAAAGLAALVAAALRADAAAHGAGNGAPAVKAALVAAVLLAAPGLVVQLFHDLGRFDVFGLILLGLVVALLPRLGRTAGLALRALAGALAILIHEAHALWVAPAALALWYDRWRAAPQALPALSTTLVGLALVTALVWRFTYARHFDLETTMEILQQRATFEVVEASVMVHFRGVADNMAYTVGHVSDARRLAGLGLGLVLLAAHGWLLLWLLGPAARRRRTEAAVLAALAFAPLALIAVGYDFGRWLAMVNVTLVLLFVAAVGRGAPVLSRLGEGGMLLLLLAVIVMLLLGPFGVTDTLPEARLWQFLGGLRLGAP